MAKVRKYRRPASQVQGFSEIGVTGLKESGGRVEEEFLPELRGRNAIRVFREMKDNDPICGAILFAVNMLIRQAEWTVTPFNDTVDDFDTRHEHGESAKEGDMTVASFVRTCLDDMSMTWHDVLTEIMTMLPFGWAYLEIVYKKREGLIPNDPGKSSQYDDGLIGWRKLPLRAQDTLDKWRFDPQGGVMGMWQKAKSGDNPFIPIQKALLFRTESAKNNPEGRSVLRNGYRPWFFKKRIEEIEGIGIERDLAGLPVIQPPEGENIWDANNPTMVMLRREAETLIRNIRRDEQEGVLMPFGWELTLLSTGGRRNFDTSQIISRYDTAIAMTVLADFIILGHNNRYGSFALAGSKTNMFGIAIGGWLQAICGVLNRYAVPRLLAMNGMDPTRPPRIGYTNIEIPDLAQLGSYIANLAKAGFKMFPNIPLEKKALQIASLPTEGLELGREAEPMDPAPDSDEEPKSEPPDTGKGTE